eukprot:m.28722 g.28722  ORF g.28722 m.28722 type:complete len:312 (-) comp8028_c0_seq4:27-962(-)
MQVSFFARRYLISNILINAPSMSTRGAKKRRVETSGDKASTVASCIMNNLEKTKDLAYKKWQENYVKGVPVRGNKMKAIREAIASSAAADLKVEEGLIAAQELLESKYGDDKLAAIVMLSEYVLCEGGNRKKPRKDLDKEMFLSKMEKMYEGTRINDWSTADWFSLKVLGPFVVDLPDAKRAKFAKRLLQWSHAPVKASTIWKRRAGHVSFVMHITPHHKQTRGDDLFYDGFIADVLKACETVILACPFDRFTNTGAGWVLRNCYLADTNRTRELLTKLAPNMTPEGLKYALEKCKDKAFKNKLTKLQKKD